MYKGKTFLAVIPARSGSKRLPEKNIRNLCGKPLLAWTIEAGKKSKYIDEVVVSTENKKIAGIGKKFGASVPFLRPKKLSTDNASSIDVILHAVSFYRGDFKKKYDYIVLLQPTSPLRTYSDIDSAIQFFENKKADAVISVCEAVHPPYWANELPKDLSMKNFLSKKNNKGKKFYQLNGAIYICKTSELLKQKTFFLKKNVFAFVMPIDKSVDIDRETDFLLAEALMKKKIRK